MPAQKEAAVWRTGPSGTTSRALEDAFEEIVMSRVARCSSRRFLNTLGDKPREERRGAVVADDAHEAVDAVSVAVSCVFGQVEIGTHANQHDLGGVAYHASYRTGGTVAESQIARRRRLAGNERSCGSSYPRTRRSGLPSR